MNNTLTNGLELLLYLADSARDHAISDLARELDLPKSHVHRLLQTLVESGYVEQSPNRRYRIGVGALRLGRSLLLNIPVRTAAMPILTRRIQEIKKPLTIAIPFGHQAISIAFLNHDGVARDSIATLGTVLSAHSSACGKLFLAHQDQAYQEEVLQNIDYKLHGPNTHKNADSLRKELQIIAQSDHSVNNLENGPTVISMAVPIYDEDNTIIAALGASEIAENISEEKKQDILSFLRSSVLEIQACMQGDLACQ